MGWGALTHNSGMVFLRARLAGRAGRRPRVVLGAAVGAVLAGAAPGLSAATVNWIPDADGQWSQATNWSSTPDLPGAADDVVIDVGAATARVITHASGTDAVASLMSNESLTLSGGSLSIGGASAFNAALNLSGGTLTGAGDATVNGTLNWTSAGMSGTGKTTISSSGMLAISHMPGDLSLGRSIDNAGIATWTGGAYFSIRFSNATFNNLATGSFAISGKTDMSPVSGVNAFNNAGTLSRSGAGTTTAIGIPFNNSGTVSIDGGTLALAGGGTQSGQFTISPGAILCLGGNQNFTAAAVISGPMNLKIASGTSTFAWPVTVGADATLAIAGGTFASASDLTVQGTLNWTGGGMSGAGKTTIAPGAVVALAPAGSNLTLARMLDNHGTINWSEFPSSSLAMAGATLSNAADGAITASGETYLYASSGAPVLNNAGTFSRSGAGSTTTLAVPFNNSGTVSVDSGTLALTGGGTQSGQFVIGQGATLALGGTQTFTSASSLTGEVSLKISSGVSTFPWAIQIAPGNALTIAGGSFASAADVTIDGALNWSSGGLTGTGKTVITPSGTLAMSWGGQDLVLARALENRGTATWIGSPFTALALSNATFTNQAGATLAASGPTYMSNLAGTNAFKNAGSFSRDGAGVTTISVNTTNTGSMAVAEGTLAFMSLLNSTGTIDIAPGAALSSNGTLSQTGGSIGGPGTLRVTGGTAGISGTQAWGAGAAIDVTGGALTLASDAGSAGERNLSINVHAGSARFNSPEHLAALAIDGGAVSMGTSGSNLLALDALSLPGSGRLDVGNNDLVLRYSGASPADALAQWITAQALFTSVQAAPGRDAALALVDNNLLHLLDWHGEPLSDGTDFDQLLVVYTWPGDANLDGQVTDADWRSTVAGMGMTGAGWFQGDLNGDGVVSADDVAVVLANLRAGTGGPLGNPLAAQGAGGLNEPAHMLAVPEPSLGALLLGGCLALGRRRRRA